MRAILDKTLGFFREGQLLSQATILEYAEGNRLMVISDCAINIAPGYAEKVKITENAVKLAHQLGMEMPKVAVVTPVEVVNTNMPSTVDAAMLSKAAQRGQIKGCIIDGPLALDNAIDVCAAQGKGIVSEVAGYADILIMPDIGAGNIFTKALHYFAHLNSSGSVCGTEIGVIMTSRTDTPEDKYCSILAAILQSLN
jgi:phosphate butyryltransferase